MSRRLYACATCGEEHAHLWQAIACCDPAAYGDDD